MAAGRTTIAGMRDARNTLDNPSQSKHLLAAEFGWHARRDDQAGKLWFFTS